MQIKIIKISIISIFVFLIGVFFMGLNKDSIYDTKGLEGQKLKNIKLEHFKKDKVISDKELMNNDFTLINFWASWCGPCLLEHPFLLKLNGKSNLEIIGVNFKDKKINAIKFLSDHGNPYDELAKDNLGKNSVDFRIYGIPESILINKDLLIIKKFIGPISQDDYEYIVKIIKE